MSDFTIRTTYKPGEGWFGYLPGSDKPLMRWGDEFWAMVKEQAAQKNAANQVKAPVLPNGPGRYDPAALETFERRKLTNAELSKLAAELAQKYDPSSMTREELDSFMDDLVEEGLLSEDELGVLGYHGYVVVGNFFDGGMIGCQTHDTSNPEYDAYFSRYGYARFLQDCNGNALAYTKLMSFFKNPSGSEAFVKYAQTQHDGYKAMANVLEAMQRQRGGANSVSNVYADSGLTWAKVMTMWKTASRPSDPLDVEDVRSGMYAALDNVLAAAMERRR